MPLIRQLDRQTINSIAAGEVIERPASVAKELIENALDAGASLIRLSMERGGISRLSCEDDGTGMDREDARMALESHATSKLSRTEDLARITTMGFRGEALPSIASISRLELKTRRRGDGEGTCLRVEGGERVYEGPCGLSPGTLIHCRDLFFNTPARYKFLRSDSAEAGAVVAMTGRMALTRPDVSFRLEEGDKGGELLYTPGDNELLSAIYAVFGQETASRMVPVFLDEPPVRITGFMTGPDFARHNRARQVFIVNGRVISSPVLRSATDEAGKTWFMKGRFPQLVLSLVIPGNLIDVNVHPQKTEVRFWDDRAVFRAVYQAVRGTLEGQARIASPFASKEPELKTEKDMDPPVSEPLQQIKMVTPAFYAQAPGADVLNRGRNESVDPMVFAESIQSPLTADRVDHKAGDPAGITSLLDARLIGSFQDTYLLLDDGEALILIDQHAAHERILYEELLARREDANGDRRLPGQLLLTPLRIEVTGQELALLDESTFYFEDLGFDYEHFGGHTIALRAVPEAAGASASIDPAAAFRAALDALASARQRGHDPDQTEVLHRVACRAAVKAHDRLNPEEIRMLIQRLTRLTNPYHCPHGRPVAVRLSRQAIEKLFGRLV